MLIMISLFSLQTAEAVPLQVTQQGRILEADGSAVSGVHNVTFRLYSDASAGTILWTEILATSFSNGYYAAVLGTDEVTNPLDSTTLALYPLYLELQLNNNSPMSPRHLLSSAPYAQLAGVAESVDGGAVNASDVSIGSVPVIDAGGHWVGQPITVDWSAITSIPSDLADGDNDTQLSEGQVEGYITNGALSLNGGTTLAGQAILTEAASTLDDLSCSSGELVGWNGTTWSCLSDNSLDESTVESFVTNAPIDLAANSTMGGAQIETELTDNDTLANLSCAVDQVATWDGANWVCADQADSTVPLASPGNCDALTAGEMYYDLVTETLQICDGSDWKKLKVCDEVCPDVEDADCGEEIFDDCGDSCGTEGTALNLDQCGAAEDLTCGESVLDECGNECGYTGSQCLTGVCNEGACCGDGVQDSSEECDDGNNTNGDGCTANCFNPPSGFAEYIEPGSYTFTVPDEVYELVGLAIGGGASGNYSGGGSSGGGGGGAKSVVAVTPGQEIEITVGRGGGNSGIVELDGGDSTIAAPFSITAGGGDAGGSGGMGSGGNLHNSAGGSGSGNPHAQKLNGDSSETGDAGGAGAWLQGFGGSNGTAGNGIGYGGGGGSQNCLGYGGSCSGGSGGVNGYDGGDVGADGGGPGGGATGSDNGDGCQGTYINGGGGGSYGGGGGNDGSGQGGAASCALDLFFGGDGAHGYVRFEWGNQ